ncbi:regulator of nonsense transcripts 1 homolog [Antedon mediterranea]|uniref:regulator of nonsense transcripts 1 homolog n=1 Tax=Antedon mediterranea TaxID=105859 RepID=UPI003AF56D2F
MHPKLAEFPSLKFYDSKLLNGVEAKRRPLPSGFPYHEKGQPIIFLDIKSKEMTTGSSKSNIDEANRIKTLVAGLLNAKQIKESEIGIISPYTAQVNLIKKTLKQKIDVRTVDGFQGQEREVIIFSAVRSNKDQFIGFLDDERRFNVLLTRARRGLIIVGNASTLRSSALWSHWINWVKEMNAMVSEADMESTTKSGRGEEAGESQNIRTEKQGDTRDSFEHGRRKRGRGGSSRGGRSRGNSNRSGSSQGGYRQGGSNQGGGSWGGGSRGGGYSQGGGSRGGRN